ncbi:antirestriction protein ArdA [Synechocystis salina LEGE 06155]|uniref:antirestriction protein ArdA n=1 Tax=Synechocystis sp. LEGE 06083 TaxID=915336 RepID=UPI001882C8B6|nr:antirestriction protein ArdA [Synechocystis sp. LEGE 06083]MBE9176801.1 antirestriction protein ArdA [Synechocystis salina LEGE 06155]MBE9193813.1 antirestriction protein ArdA [Synechocystis sp. LEGE 06083]
MLSPEIYVACLASYNNGLLHGEWISANQDEDEIMAEIEAMLKVSPMRDAEEWAIHDYQNFGGIELKEYEDIETIAKLGQALAEHGEAMAAYYKCYDNLENFEDYYLGEYESEEDFVYDYFEQIGQLEAIEKAGLDSFYIDFEKLAHDWFINDFYSAEISYNKVYVFSRH